MTAEWLFLKLLALHSIFRWLATFGLLAGIGVGYWGWIGNRAYGVWDDRIRKWAMILAQIQMAIGLWLYFVSPTVKVMFNYFSVAVHQRDVRFFGMEHITSMILAVAMITLGSIKAKRKAQDSDKFRLMAIWFTIAAIIILFAAPWPFMPFVQRPWIRF